MRVCVHVLVYVFPNPLSPQNLTYAVGTYWNGLSEAIPISTHIIYFCREIRTTNYLALLSIVMQMIINKVLLNLPSHLRTHCVTASPCVTLHSYLPSSLFSQPTIPKIQRFSRLLISYFPAVYWKYTTNQPWKQKNDWTMFVCVEVLRPSQPNGVMSSAVSLLNHTFTGQA